MSAPVRHMFVAGLLVAGIALSGCTERTELAGRVVDDAVTVEAPLLSAPSPDLDAGFSDRAASGSGSSSTAQGGSSRFVSAASLVGLGKVSRVESVAVSAGERVEAGALIAAFETEALGLQLAAAQAARTTARAQLPVLDEALGDVASNRSDVAINRKDVTSAISKLTKTRKDLAAQRSAIKKQLSASPPAPVAAQLKAGVKKLDAAIKKLDAGLKTTRSGLKKLDSARSKLSDARVQLESVRDLARIAADATEVGVEFARYQRNLAEVRSPVAGMITSVAKVGDVMAAGATVAVLRPDGPTRVSTWLAPEDLRFYVPSPISSFRQPARATITADWLAGEISGSITRVGTRALYPPTSFATRDVHLTRAVEVEITLEGDGSEAVLPAGAPVDVYLK